MIKGDFTNKEEVEKKILAFVGMPDYRPVVADELAASLTPPEKKTPEFISTLRSLELTGAIMISKGKKILPPTKGRRVATMLSLTKTGGFAALSDGSGDIFIQKHRLAGAMPTDVVSVRMIGSTGRLPEAEVVKIIQRNFTEFTGRLIKRGKNEYVVPDSGMKEKLDVVRKGSVPAHDGDKVLARMKEYGAKGEPGKAVLVTVYGSADSAASCSLAVLDRKHVRREFPPEVIEEARRVSARPVSEEGRLDLRALPIFTIDGAHTKDIDDAVSAEKTPSGYRLGVHIADVSDYVTPDSALDAEAYARGTSIYYADQVIPMLPKELSNGICSLNPGEDRQAFSVLMEIDGDGKMTGYELHKSVIRSRVKGVYDEINRIFAGENDAALNEKYRAVLPSLGTLRELAGILGRARKARGALDFESKDCEILVDDSGVACDVKRSDRGESEQMIEDFMLMANAAVASYASGLKIPFVYRVHEAPGDEKLENLTIALKAAGIDAKAIHPGLKPSDVAKVLAQIEGRKDARALSDMVLRSLAKARYSPECLGHFGLALQYYSHFTSPIRRYPDLAIHRILSDLLKEGPGKSLVARYRKFADAAAEQSSLREVNAMQVEWDCDAIYMAEYMSFHIGEQFEGVVTSVKSYGMYIELENTVEGLVRVENLPGGWYDYDETTLSLFCARSGKRYSIGDTVRVLVAKAEVSLGQIDFELI